MLTEFNTGCGLIFGRVTLHGRTQLYYLNEAIPLCIDSIYSLY